jgi:hypothetical protein
MGPTSALVATMMGRKISRALNAGDIERAVRIAERYRKMQPREPAAYFYEYEAKNHLPNVDRAAQLALLRKGWAQAPYHGAVADVLLIELFREECVRPDPSLRAEARRVLDQVISLYGDGPWSNLWLAELAQLEGDWVSAKQYVEMTLPMLENRDSTFLKGYLRAGMSLSSIPGEESRGEQMLLDSIDRYPGPWGHVLYALVVEEHDPDRAREHLELARGLWDDTFKSFDDEIAVAREFHRQNVRRLTLVSSN